MHSQTITTLCLIIVACFVAATANAQPVYFSGTDHYYEHVNLDLTWLQAKADAGARSHLGMAGHLVTITSQAENSFLQNTLRTASRCWLGGYQPEGSSEPGGGWTWVTDEPWTFEDWAAGEPNNMAGEDYLEFFPWDYSEGRWNDYPGTRTQPFIVEYSIPIPEPTTLALAAFGALGLLLRRRLICQFIANKL